MEYKVVTVPAEWKPAPRVCRCCLSEGCYKDISTEYYWLGEKEMYSQMLKECFDLTISLSEAAGSSRLICEVCITRLRDASNFKKQVINSEKRFAEHLRSGASLSVVEAQETPVILDIKVEGVKDEAAISDDDPDPVDDDIADPDYDESDDLPLKFEVQKKESMTELSFGDEIPALNTSETTIKKVSSKTKDKSALKKLKMNKRELTIKPVKASTSKKKDKVAKTKVKAAKPGAKKGATGPVDVYDKTVKRGIINCKVVKSYEKSSEDVTIEKNESAAARATLKWIGKNIPSTKLSPCNRSNVAALLEFTDVYPFFYKCGKFSCFVCKQICIDKNSLIDHYSNHTTHEKSNAVQKHKKSTENDRVLKVDVSDIKCNSCLVNFSNIDSLMQHLQLTHEKLIHPMYTKNLIPFRLSSKDFTCHICEKNYSSMGPLVLHMKEHFPNYSCEVCGKGFTTMGTLRVHKSSSHEPQGSYCCERCRKVFTSRLRLASHVSQVHTNRLTRVCQICSARFIDASNLIKHKEKDHGVTPKVFKCEHCEVKFLAAYRMRNHIRIVHRKEKPYECTICRERFTASHSLKLHNVRHTGARDFKCSTCEKTFSRRATLVQHMRIHDNDRRFVCNICSQGFIQKVSLSSHMKSSHSAIQT